MLNKFTFTILGAISFIIFSCNRIEEKKNDKLSGQTNSTNAETLTPSDDFTLLEKKLEQDSLNIEIRTTLAAGYYSAKQLNKAAYHFLKIYERDKNNLNALSNLGNIYYDNKQEDKAIQFYEKALTIAPENINMKCDLAVSYFGINKLKKAIQMLKENIKMDYNHAQSHYNLSVILNQSGQINEADEEMKIYKTLTAGKN